MALIVEVSHYRVIDISASLPQLDNHIGKYMNRNLVKIAPIVLGF